MDFQTGQKENLCKEKKRKKEMDIQAIVGPHITYQRDLQTNLDSSRGLFSPRPYMSHFYILVRQNKRLVIIFIFTTVSGAYLALGDKSNLRCHMERSLFLYQFKLLLRTLTFAEGCYYTTNNNVSTCKSFYFVLQVWVL